MGKHPYYPKLLFNLYLCKTRTRKGLYTARVNISDSTNSEVKADTAVLRSIYSVNTWIACSMPGIKAGTQQGTSSCPPGAYSELGRQVSIIRNT